MLECWIAWIHLSDHEVLITFLSLNNTSALKMWSLDNSWLKVSEFRDYLRQQISFYLELNEASAPSPSALWDILKAIIKGQIILYIMRRKKDLCWQLWDLEGWIRDPQRHHFMSKKSSYSMHSPLCAGWELDLSDERRGRGAVLLPQPLLAKGKEKENALGKDACPSSWGNWPSNMLQRLGLRTESKQGSLGGLKEILPMFMPV